MMQALRYERPGQRFAQGERPRREWQPKHIHLHLHLHLTFPVRQRRSAHSGAFPVTRIFTALVGATVMAFLLFGTLFDSPATSSFHVTAFFSFLAGLVIAWIAALAMLIEAWRSTPRVRLLFNRSIHRAALVDSWLRQVFRLSLVMVGGMVLLLLGALIECLTLIFATPGWFQMVFSWPVWLPLLGMCVAVIVAVHALFSWPRSYDNAKARPKDDSPSEADSSPHLRGYRG